MVSRQPDRLPRNGFPIGFPLSRFVLRTFLTSPSEDTRARDYGDSRGYTPKVYFDGLNTTAPTITRYPEDEGYGQAAKNAVKKVLVDFPNSSMLPKLQAFIDRHGRMA
jgi:hypothetical protein